MIKNHTENNSDAHINAMRKAFEHRATWYALLIDEAVKHGLDASFAREAINRCGSSDGTNKFDPTCTDIEAFAKVFATHDIQRIFDMEATVDTEENSLTCVFHYCPLVAAWQKLGLDDAVIDHLCDMAMEGDRAIAAQNPNMVFELGDTIGHGCDTCVVKFSIRK